MSNPSRERQGAPDSLDAQTREIVLRAFRTILTTNGPQPTHFEIVGAVVGLSEQQLKAEWISIEALASDSLMPVRVPIDADIFGLSRIQRLERFLSEIDRAFDEPTYQPALTKVIRWASTNDSAALALSSVRLASQREFARLVGPVSEDNYVQIVGPIYFHRLHANGPMPKKMMRMVVDRGMTLLGMHREASG